MSTDIICQLAYDGKLEELQIKFKDDLKLACKKFQVSFLSFGYISTQIRSLLHVFIRITCLSNNYICLLYTSPSPRDS